MVNWAAVTLHKRAYILISQKTVGYLSIGVVTAVQILLVTEKLEAPTV